MWLMRSQIILAATFLLAYYQVQGKCQIRVSGVNSYPADPRNVQSALDSVEAGGTVVLQGRFDFGQATIPAEPGFEGGVTVSTARIQILGEDATIIGGGKEHPLGKIWGGGLLYVINVEAHGVTIRNLTLTGATDAAILVHAPATKPSDDPITISGNVVEATWSPIIALLTPCPIRILDNDIETVGFGVNTKFNGSEGKGSLEISNNRIVSPRTPHWLACIESRYNQCPVEIVGNSIYAEADANRGTIKDGIRITSWNVDYGLDQDNPPVTVKDNFIDMRVDDCQDWFLCRDFSIGISIGRGDAGTNNTVVENNKLKGTMAAGLTIGPYSKNIRLKGNDLSELETWDAQIAIWGSTGSLVADNVLGFANMVPSYSTALLLTSVNWHEPGGTPAPYPTEECEIRENDYRHTGMPGWSNGEEGFSFGCIAIFSHADSWGTGKGGSEIRDNLVNETGRFPVGTGGVGKHVFEWSPSGLVYQNRIVGLPADHVYSTGVGKLLMDVRSRKPTDIKVMRNRPPRKMAIPKYRPGSVGKIE
jgi:hypothetical protein